MLNNQKDIAKAFIQGVVTDKVREVFDLYTLPNFKHHNGYYSPNRK